MAYVIKESGRWQSFKSDFLEIPRIGVQDEKLEIPQTLSQQSPLETILENTRLSLYFSPSRGFQTTEKCAWYPRFVNGNEN